MMKKAISLILAFVLCLFLCACGGEQTPETTAPETTVPETTEPTVKVELGEMVSSGLVDFQLTECQFSYYANNTMGENYLKPTEESNSFFAASMGHCFVAMTFYVRNNDRGGSINMGGYSNEWPIEWTVNYNGEEYEVRSFDLNERNGAKPFKMVWCVINGADEENGGQNHLLDAGYVESFRTIGMIAVEPEQLTDGFELTINLPTTSGEFEYYTYVIPPQ